VVLVFDLDGTLVKSNFFSDVLLRMICERFEKHNICIDRAEIFREIFHRFIQKLNAEDKRLAYDWDELVRDYLEDYDVTWEAEIENLFNSEEIIQYSSLYKDAKILEWLLEEGYELALLTNGLDKYQDSIIEKLGIERFFKRIVKPDPKNIRLIKPYPEIFKETVKGFKKPYVMIGDSLYFDIYGAKQAEFQTIWLLRKPPLRYKKLSIPTRTKKINQNQGFLLNHIRRGVSFLKIPAHQINLDHFRPDHVICNLNELKELLLENSYK